MRLPENIPKNTKEQKNENMKSSKSLYKAY